MPPARSSAVYISAHGADHSIRERLTTFGKVTERPSASFCPDLVPAPENPEIPNTDGP